MSDSVPSYYDSFTSLHSRPPEKPNAEKPAESEPFAVTQSDDDARKNSTTSPSMAQSTPLARTQRRQSKHVPDAAATSSLSEPSHAELPQSNSISIMTETPLTSRMLSNLPTTSDSEYNQEPTENASSYYQSDSRSQIQESVNDELMSTFSPLAVNERIRENLQRKQLIHIDSVTDSPSSLSDRSKDKGFELILYPPQTTSTPIFTSSNLCIKRSPQKKRKPLSEIAENGDDKFNEAQATALCGQLRKMIDDVNGAQRVLFIAQKAYFVKERSKLDAERAKFIKENDAAYEEVYHLFEELEKETEEYENKCQEIEKGWNELEKARSAFVEEKNAENARLAQMRSSINQTQTLRASKEAKAKIDELEEKVKKLTEIVHVRDQRVSDLRAKLTREQGLRATAQKEAESNAKANNELKTLRKKIASVQTENTQLRVHLSQARGHVRPVSANSSAMSSTSANSSFGGGSRTRASVMRPNSNSGIRATASTDNLASNTASGVPKRVRWSSTLTRSNSTGDLMTKKPYFTMPGPYTRNTLNGLVNTMYRYTTRGNEFTFQNGLNSMLVTELKCCCKLVERNNGDFTWRYKPAADIVELNYFADTGTFELWTPLKHRVLLFSDKKFELHYPNGNLTAIEPSGKRVEMFATEEEDDMGQPIYCFELYEPGVETAVRWSTVDDPVEFEPQEKHSVPYGDYIVHFFRRDGSFSINTADVKVSRVYRDGYVKMSFMKNSPPLQLNFCPEEGALLIQHILTDSDGTKMKRVCFKYGESELINASIARI